VEELVPHDAPARRAFRQWIFQQSAEDPTFTAKTLLIKSFRAINRDSWLKITDVPRKTFSTTAVVTATDFTIVLFSDESCFTRKGITNIHKDHVRSDDNTHEIRSHHQQSQSSINLWVGILGEYLMRPYILPGRVRGHDYFNFLLTHLSGLLEDVSVNTHLYVQFQHGGALPHYRHEVLSKNYRER
jgi:hypothetical protein